MKTTALRVRRFVPPRGAALDARPFLYGMSNALCHASRRRVSPFVLARFPRRRSSFARSTPRASSSSSNRPIVADPRRPRPALDHARARETSARAIDRGVAWANSSSAATDRKICPFEKKLAGPVAMRAIPRARGDVKPARAPWTRTNTTTRWRTRSARSRDCSRTSSAAQTWKRRPCGRCKSRWRIRWDGIWANTKTLYAPRYELERARDREETPAR